MDNPVDFDVVWFLARVHDVQEYLRLAVGQAYDSPKEAVEYARRARKELTEIDRHYPKERRQ